MSSSKRLKKLILSLALFIILLTSTLITSICVTGNLYSTNPLINKIKVISPTGLSGDPGDNITYIFHIQNIGGVTDSYNYTITSNVTTWTITGSLSGLIGPLAPGETSGNITVNHHIWENASAHDFCRLEFTAWSNSEGFIVNDFGYTLTTANPISKVAINPPSSTPGASAYPGENTTLIFTIWNLGNCDDNYELTVNTQYYWMAYVIKEIFIRKGGWAPCSVTVMIPAFSTKWTENDFIKNGTFYNSKGLVTLTATAKYMPARASAGTKIRILPYYQAGLSAFWDTASVDPYNSSSGSINNKAEYLLKVSNMNNYPTQDGGTADISLTVTPPSSTPGDTPSWSAGFDPPSPFTIIGRNYNQTKLIVTEPPGQESGDYITKISGFIKPQTGSVSDPVKTPSFELKVITKVGVQGGVTVTAFEHVIQTFVKTKSVSVKFDLFNYGSGRDSFKLNGSTTHGWIVKISNASEMANPVVISIDRDTNFSVTMTVDVPDGVKVNENETIYLTATSENDPVNGTDSASCILIVITLYRIRINCEQNYIGIAPGQPLDVNYTIANLGSNTETIRVSYSKEGTTSNKWIIPTEKMEWVMKSNTTQIEYITITPPADPIWHEHLTVVIHSEIRNSLDEIVVTSEVNITLEIRMLLMQFPKVTDTITTYAMPGESRTYHISSWNLGTKGPDNVKVHLEGQPAGWDAYFVIVGSTSKYRSEITSPILHQYNESFDFKLILNIPTSAEERNNVLQNIFQ